VLRQDVEELQFAGSPGYWCECYAWNSAAAAAADAEAASPLPRSAKSRRTIILAACQYIKCTELNTRNCSL